MSEFGQKVIVVPVSSVCGALLERGVGHAVVIGLRVDVALALHLDLELVRERVDDRAADAVQAAGHRVSAAAELAAGVQDGQHDLDGRLLLDRVHVDRDAAAVVDDPQSAIGEDRDLDVVAVPGEGLVDGVVDDLVDEVVQAARAGRADVHARTLADRFEALENLDVAGAVRRLGGRRRGRCGHEEGGSCRVGRRRPTDRSGPSNSISAAPPKPAESAFCGHFVAGLT